WTGGGEAELGTTVTPMGWRTLLQAGAQADVSRLRSNYASFQTPFDPFSGHDGLVASTVGWRTNASGSLGARTEITPHTIARVSVRGDLARVHADDALSGTSTPRRTMSALSPLVAVNQSLGDRAGVYASFSTAFRVPTLFQLY